MNAPLRGRRVVNTRAVHQAGALDRLLRENGAIPVAYPCIAIAPPPNAAELDESLDRLAAGEFDWLVLTSSNTVHALATQLKQRDGRIGNVRIAAVGPSTAESTERLLGVTPAFVPATYTGFALSAGVPVEPGSRVLLPASEIAEPELADQLRRRGAIVEVVTAYRTVVGRGGSDLPRLLADGQIDALTFCSSSAVDGFVARMENEGGSLLRALALPAICIGPNTQATALDHGFRSPSAAETQTLDGLIDSLQLAFSVQPQGGPRWH